MLRETKIAFTETQRTRGVLACLSSRPRCAREERVVETRSRRAPAGERLGRWAEMTRRCSHCSNNGHNSRTCPARGGGVRLFGVRLTDGVGAMKKSASMGCLSSAAALSMAGASPSADPAGDHPDAAAAASGYASDEPAHASSSSICRKKGPTFPLKPLMYLYRFYSLTDTVEG
ncbi:hypothetical protein BHM03_00050082 [Ensete ventricosum]|nr:hypothetical protein BHM03_00050082 [Ensete ventricosum]